MKFLLKASSLLITLILTACGGSDNAPGVNVQQENPAPVPTTPQTTAAPKLSFNDSTAAKQLSLVHSFSSGSSMTMPMMYSGGIAAGDYDNDGDIDLYLIAGSGGNNGLFQNQGDGSFLEVASDAGVAISGVKGIGPAFADIDGDGWLDLFVGGIDGQQPTVFLNKQDGTFSDETSASGLVFTAPNSISANFGDIDLDGDLDMLVSHWGNPLEEGKSLEILWQNNSQPGQIRFQDVSTAWGFNQAYSEQIDKVKDGVNTTDTSFVPSLSDIDQDGDLDLLLVSDFGETKVLRNDLAAGFVNITTSQIDDQFGMGSAVADIDNDGDMDWYVTSIHQKATSNQARNPSQGYTGNRLYINDGQGNFINQGFGLQVADGGWAWASCIADFNNDGLSDIFHVNGWGQDGLDFAHYIDDNSRLFLQQPNGEFIESARELGIIDARQGRAIVCNDLDDDGDIDIVVSNNQTAARVFVNELESGYHYVTVVLKGLAPNIQAFGARIQLTTASGKIQTKEIGSHNHFASMSAPHAHFGLAEERGLVNIQVTWPDGSIGTYNNLQIDRVWTLEQSE
ncbi:CRTAC1 family protein [Aliiglaciecola sp. M165]|uniref:CRTAC1 family protein n=1 Tax=Aliiglaciecola sp. M165 TaxID=2593649 RepID=UPI00117D2F28|nr:CRTAC1 family protein [Aliiglaciecola sp. M165]TRY29829.1 CRTAC1 family protein [Aliiglaciecola sp. M165]